MTKEEIEEKLTGLKPHDIVKVKNEKGERIFLGFWGQNKKGEFRFYADASGCYWIYLPTNDYFYWEPVGDIPQSVRFRKIDIAEIEIIDSRSFVVSLISFLNRFSRDSKREEFLDFLLS